MGSASDWETMQHTAQTLDDLGVPYEKRVISAHRTPQLMYEWAAGAAARGIKIVIAGAGGAAHLAGVAAALTPLPVLGVPMESASLKGLDSLLSMVQMPGGIPVATFAIGKPGAVNAALFAAAILALRNDAIKEGARRLPRRAGEESRRRQAYRNRAKSAGVSRSSASSGRSTAATSPRGR